MLWSALVRHPGSTATELATAAGTAASTARRILSRWAVTGAGHRDRVRDNPRAADRWSVAAAYFDTNHHSSNGPTQSPTWRLSPHAPHPACA